MPHLTIEYTDNIPGFNAGEVLAELNTVLIQSTLFEEVDVKGRALRLDNHLVGNGGSAGRRAFVHVKVAMLAGRSPDTRRSLSEKVMEALGKHCRVSDALHVQLCVEIQEIDGACYVKASLGG